MMMMIIIIIIMVIIIIVIITVDVDELMFSPLWVWQSFRTPWTSLLSAITIFTRILICWSADADGIKGTSPWTRIIFIKQEWTATCEKQHSQEWESERGDERRREWRGGARREFPQTGLDQPFSLWKIVMTSMHINRQLVDSTHCVLSTGCLSLKSNVDKLNIARIVNAVQCQS